MEPHEQQTGRKTSTYTLRPTPEQVGTMAFVLRRCRERSNAGLHERRDAWPQCSVSITAASQSAQLPEIKEERRSSAAIHAQAVQDVLSRLQRALQAFFRRVTAGRDSRRAALAQDEARPPLHRQAGWPRGRARLENGFLILSKIGRIGVRWSRPLEGTPKTSTIRREADG